MEQLGVLPTPEAVLNKLKSDGTFDQLRKSCLATIEAEPSFRAHGEHVEILTRRYLQDFKWKENTSRNEVRAKLRSYVIGAIAKPELAVGMPLGALVEKTLEAQAKELLPKITEKVEILRASKDVPISDSNPLVSSNGPNTVTANSSGAPEVSSSKIGSDFGGLPLPIEIPGLTAPKKEAASTGGSGSDITSSKSAKSKPKVAADGSSSKDGVKGVQKFKPGGTSSGKVGQTALPKESVKQKERGEKSGTDTKEPLGEIDSKEKIKGTSKIKKSKEEKLKDSQEKNQKPQALISKEKGADAKECAKKEAGKGAQKESSRLITKGESDKNESKDAEIHSSAEADAKAPDTDSKNLPSRRSARLASLTENKDEEAASSEPEEQHSKRDIVSGNKSNTSDDESIADKWQRRKKRQRPVKVTSRKRARVLRSSSEDSEQEMSESDDEEGYESETEEPAEEERLSKKTKSGSARKFEASRKRKHMLPESEEDNTGLTKKSRTLKQHSKLQLSMKRRLKLSLSPVPVVTRYNRQVKPNRKYCVSEEDPGESEKEEEEQQQVGTEESSTEPQDQEIKN